MIGDCSLVIKEATEKFSQQRINNNNAGFLGAQEFSDSPQILAATDPRRRMWLALCAPVVVRSVLLSVDVRQDLRTGRETLHIHPGAAVPAEWRARAVPLNCSDYFSEQKQQPVLDEASGTLYFTDCAGPPSPFPPLPPPPSPSPPAGPPPDVLVAVDLGTGRTRHVPLLTLESALLPVPGATPGSVVSLVVHGVVPGNGSTAEAAAAAPMPRRFVRRWRDDNRRAAGGGATDYRLLAYELDAASLQLRRPAVPFPRSSEGCAAVYCLDCASALDPARSTLYTQYAQNEVLEPWVNSSSCASQHRPCVAGAFCCAQAPSPAPPQPGACYTQPCAALGQKLVLRTRAVDLRTGAAVPMLGLREGPQDGGTSAIQAMSYDARSGQILGSAFSLTAPIARSLVSFGQGSQAPGVAPRTVFEYGPAYNCTLTYDTGPNTFDGQTIAVNGSGSRDGASPPLLWKLVQSAVNTSRFDLLGVDFRGGASAVAAARPGYCVLRGELDLRVNISCPIVARSN